MTYYLLLLSIFVWPFGQLLTFQIPGIPTSVYLLDIVLGITAVSLVLSRQHRKLIFSDILFKPLVIFLLASSISLAINLRSLSQVDILVSLFYLCRLFIYPFAYFAIKLFPKKRIYSPLIISFSIFCLLGIFQYLFFPDMRFLKLIGFDDHYWRLIGSFFDPNFVGAILAGSALFLIASEKWLPVIPITVMLALTFSRASYLCFAVGIVFILLNKKKIVYLGLLLLLAIIVVLIPKPFGEGVNLLRTFSIFSRIDSWNSGLDLFLQKPILGWGYNTLRSINGERFQIDNSYLYIAATTGVIGLVLFLNLIYRSYKSISSLSGQSFLLLIILHSLFNNSLFYIWIFFAYWIMLGFSAKEYKQS